MSRRGPGRPKKVVDYTEEESDKTENVSATGDDGPSRETPKATIRRLQMFLKPLSSEKVFKVEKANAKLGLYVSSEYAAR